MTRFILALVFAALASAAVAQQHLDALIVNACGSQSLVAATYGYLTMDTTGKLCDSGGVVSGLCGTQSLTPATYGYLVVDTTGKLCDSGGGVVPPPTCSNELDFTQACNSQYVGVF